MFRLNLLFCLIAVVGLGRSYAATLMERVKLTETSSYLVIRNDLPVPIAAVMLGTSHWLVELDKPLIPANSETVIPLTFGGYGHGEKITGIITERGQLEGPPSLRALIRLRNQMLAGTAVDVTGIDYAWYHYFLGLARARRHNNKWTPMLYLYGTGDLEGGSKQ